MTTKILNIGGHASVHGMFSVTTKPIGSGNKENPDPEPEDETEFKCEKLNIDMFNIKRYDEDNVKIYGMASINATASDGSGEARASMSAMTEIKGQGQSISSEIVVKSNEIELNTPDAKMSGKLQVGNRIENLDSLPLQILSYENLHLNSMNTIIMGSSSFAPHITMGNDDTFADNLTLDVYGDQKVNGNAFFKGNIKNVTSRPLNINSTENINVEVDSEKSINLAMNSYAPKVIIGGDEDGEAGHGSYSNQSLTVYGSAKIQGGLTVECNGAAGRLTVGNPSFSHEDYKTTIKNGAFIDSIMFYSLQDAGGNDFNSILTRINALEEYVANHP